jgi:Host cell surface-exposed lipoprotein/Protein of unknown function (DUF732)
MTTIISQPPQRKHHGVRNGCLLGFGIVVLALVVIAAALSGGSKPATTAGHMATTHSPATTPQSDRKPGLFVTEASSIWPALGQVPPAKLVSLGDTVCSKRAEGVSQRDMIKAATNSNATALGINDVQRFVLLAETTLCPAYISPVIKTGPVATVSQQNALSSAQDYLSMQAFSKAGLIDQLSSKSGEGFPKTDAVWAVNHLHVSWFKEAVKSARDYLSMQSFSRSGLIDQLSSPYGEQFTVAQATYAANKVGL